VEKDKKEEHEVEENDCDAFDEEDEPQEHVDGV